MAQQEIDVGSIAGDGTGDPLRDAFTKINENFSELYSGNVQVTGANVLVHSVAGRTGNVVLTVSDVAQAASKSYVNLAIASNVAVVNNSISIPAQSLFDSANIAISDISSRITTLETNASVQSAAITNLDNIKATIAYVDQSIDLALSSNAILADVASVNANVAAANAAILTKASLSGADFTGNITASGIKSSDSIRAETYFVAGTEATQGLGQQWANPAALFFADTSALPQNQKYYQINLQNLDPLGSGDIVVTSNDGNDGSNYINMGINGSQFVDPSYPGSYPHDGYLYVTGGDLNLLSATSNVKIQAGTIPTAQIILTTANIIQLGQDVKIRFADGTVQTTAFGGNLDTVSINANISAANVAIASLQANALSQALDINSLYANAGSQSSAINILIANAASQSISITDIYANLAVQTSNSVSQADSLNLLLANAATQAIAINTLSANAAIQALDINNLYSNAAVQGSIINTLSANAATQAIAIDSLLANAAIQDNALNTLTANAATQAIAINTLTANAAIQALSITSLQSNAASQALDIDYLYSNVAQGFGTVITNAANIAAANASIRILDANLGSTSTNVNILQANAVTQGSQIVLLNANIAAANVTKADLSGAIFSGNVQADYLIANANVKISGIPEIGVAAPIDYPNKAGIFVGNVDSYYQLVVQNLNGGPNASGDIVITADDGTDTDGYINIGINNSGFQGNFIVPAGDTGLQEFAHDGYFEVIGGNAVLRTDENIFIAANTKIVGLLKDGNFSLINTDLRFKDGTVMVTANIGAQPYSPNNSANYDATITNIQEALDELAARLRALGG